MVLDCLPAAHGSGYSPFTRFTAWISHFHLLHHCLPLTCHALSLHGSTRARSHCTALHHHLPLLRFPHLPSPACVLFTRFSFLWFSAGCTRSAPPLHGHYTTTCAPGSTTSAHLHCLLGLPLTPTHLRAPSYLRLHHTPPTTGSLFVCTTIRYHVFYHRYTPHSLHHRFCFTPHVTYRRPRCYRYITCCRCSLLPTTGDRLFYRFCYLLLRCLRYDDLT